MELKEYELYSLKERRIYPINNAIPKVHLGVAIICTPAGEPLVVKKR